MTVATFEMIVSVLPGDIDEKNHVNNTVYLRWIQDVAGIAGGHRLDRATARDRLENAGESGQRDLVAHLGR